MTDTTDLPEGYRWATADETEDYLVNPDRHPDMIVVHRTADAAGNPYTGDEADLAMPWPPLVRLDTRQGVKGVPHAELDEMAHAALHDAWRANDGEGSPIQSALSGIILTLLSERAQLYEAAKHVLEAEESDDAYHYAMSRPIQRLAELVYRT